MKTNFILAALIISMTACAYSASGEAANINSGTRDLDNFYGLIINSPANVIIQQGEKSSIRFEGEVKDLKKVDTYIENGSLIISGNNLNPLTIFVTIEELNLIEVNGNARVYSKDLINSDLLLLKVNGSGVIHVDVRSLSVGMIVKGSGKIYASGSTGSSFSRVYGNGGVYSKDLDSFHTTEEVNTGNQAVRSSSRRSEAVRPMLKLHN